MSKHIFVTGGVVSGLGKGITAASLGRLLKARGLKIAAQKLDPYLNVDPGTLSPYQHGEVYVTEDGAETDLDLGHYERFIDENLNQFSNLTSGRAYQNVIDQERRGAYMGKTVQVIPHITDEIKGFIYKLADHTKADVVITEIGGTIGDMESAPFLEAARQVWQELGPDNVIFIHVTLVPYLKASKEHKSKPTQHSVNVLQSLGIQPDILVLRSDNPLPPSIFQKVSLFGNVPEEAVISNISLDTLYEAPLMLEESHLSDLVCKKLKLQCPEPNLRAWRDLVDHIKHPKHQVTIGLVGKYVQLHDAYLSVAEALRHAGYPDQIAVDIRWIDAEAIVDQGPEAFLKDVDGVIVPGGFGGRGVEGLIAACQYAREKDLPLLGICLGMQCMVIDYARQVCGWKLANSREFDPESPYKVIDFMPGQNDEIDIGGTLRLGAYPCQIAPDSQMAQAYGGADLIEERHRHRYEFNNDFREDMIAKGLVLSGLSQDGKLVEAVEVPGKRFCLGVQFHPEFKSRPNRPHPLFLALIRAAQDFRQEKNS